MSSTSKLKEVSPLVGYWEHLYILVLTIGEVLPQLNQTGCLPEEQFSPSKWGFHIDTGYTPKPYLLLNYS